MRGRGAVRDTTLVPGKAIMTGTRVVGADVSRRYAVFVVSGAASWPASPARRASPRPKTNVSYGVDGSVVVPVWRGPVSSLTAGMAKKLNVIVVSPRRRPGSTSKIAYP